MLVLFSPLLLGPSSFLEVSLWNWVPIESRHKRTCREPLFAALYLMASRDFDGWTRWRTLRWLNIKQPVVCGFVKMWTIVESTHGKVGVLVL